MDVNVTGAFHCIREAVPHDDRGALRPHRHHVVRDSQTAAVTALCPLHHVEGRAGGNDARLARSSAEFGITVNAILPGSIETGVARPSPVTSADREQRAMQSQAIPRVLTPNDLAGAALFLASDAAAFITGQSLAVDGRLTFG